MVAANVALAGWLNARGRSGLRRVVRAPERRGLIVAIASQYGEALPADPDPRALAALPGRRRRADSWTSEGDAA